MELLRVTVMVILLLTGWQVRADETLTITENGVFEREIDLTGWEQGLDFVTFLNKNCVEIAYPWMGEDTIDYRIEEGRLTVNDEIVGVFLDEVQGKVNPDGIVTIYVPHFMIDEIKDYPSLGVVTVSGYWNKDNDTVDLSFFKEFPDLRYLHFSAGGHVNPSHINAISQCSQLVSLKFDVLVLPEGGLSEIRKLENLRSITVASMPEEEMFNLAGHPNLRSIYMRWSGMGPGWAGFLETLPRIQGLTVIESEIDTQALAYLAKSNKLTYLSFPYAGIDGDKVKYISQMTNLRYLDLYWTDVGDDDIAHLAGLTNLETLHLGGYALTGHGLRHLAGMSSLKTLGVSPESTGVALKHLAGLTNIEHLILSLPGSQITDEELEKLKEFTHLRILDLPTNEISDEEIENLRKALPDCKIIQSKYLFRY